MAEFSMDYDTYKRINDERMNYREMEDADVVSSYRNVGCGDGYRLYLKIENDTITDASYTTTGCGFGLTALAMLTEILKGKTVQQAEALTEADIERVFEFPPRRKNYPQSAIEALRKALEDLKNGTGIPPEERVTKKNMLVLLKEQGHLRGAKLNSIILEDEDLSGVDFEGANLQNGFLQKANFSGANLQNANLRGAFLNDADLTGADLRGADLRFTKLTGAKLEGAQFEGALYDVGTRVLPNMIHIFDVMEKRGKDVYVKSASEVIGE